MRNFKKSRNKKLFCGIFALAAIILIGGGAFILHSGILDPICVTAESETYDYYATSFPVYLDGYPMQAYYCDEKILVSMDDLTSCGFEMNYDASSNIINLRTQSDIEGTPQRQALISGSGTAVPCTLDCRINGIKISAYALDNYACVSVDDLVYLSDEYNVWWGWSDYNMNGGYNSDTNSFDISVFRPKVYDWAALLAEMQDKVNKTELEIYTEGDTDEAVYYGARLEPRSGVYSGIVSDGNGNPEIGEEAIFDHDFGVYSSYLEFDDFQTQLNKPSSYIIPEKDCISQVPWNISDINLVLDGTNDDYIRETLDNMAAYNKPTIIRFGAEMNIGTLGDSPSAYVKAFRKIADIVHEYPNFAVMWSPNDSGSLDRPFWYYYPGDEYVDWIGVSSFSKKDFFNSLLISDDPQPITTRESQIYFTLGDFGYTTNSLKYITDFMSEYNINKPLAISEGGVVTRLSYTDEDFEEWGLKRIRNMYWYAAMRYPQLKSIVYFNHDMETEVIGFDLRYKPSYISVMDEAFSNGQYLMSYSDRADFVFVKAGGGRTYSDMNIPIYGYVYQPEQDTDRVEYYIDGVLCDTQYVIPYRTNIDVFGISDGTHTLTMTAYGENSTDTAEYTLTKQAGTVTIY